MFLYKKLSISGQKLSRITSDTMLIELPENDFFVVPGTRRNGYLKVVTKEHEIGMIATADLKGLVARKEKQSNVQKFLTLLEKLTNEQIHLVYLAVIIISYLMYLAANKIILKTISRIFKKTSTEIDDILIEKKVFNKIPYLIPLIFIYGMRNFLPLFEAIERVLLFFIALVVLISINAFVNAVNVVYTRSKFASKLNIKSYIQVLKLAINML